MKCKTSRPLKSVRPNYYIVVVWVYRIQYYDLRNYTSCSKRVEHCE